MNKIYIAILISAVLSGCGDDNGSARLGSGQTIYSKLWGISSEGKSTYTTNDVLPGIQKVPQSDLKDFIRRVFTFRYGSIDDCEKLNGQYTQSQYQECLASDKEVNKIIAECSATKNCNSLKIADLRKYSVGTKNELGFDSSLLIYLNELDDSVDNKSKWSMGYGNIKGFEYYLSHPNDTTTYVHRQVKSQNKPSEPVFRQCLYENDVLFPGIKMTKSDAESLLMKTVGSTQKGNLQNVQATVANCDVANTCGNISIGTMLSFAGAQDKRINNVSGSTSGGRTASPSLESVLGALDKYDELVFSDRLYAGYTEKWSTNNIYEYKKLGRKEQPGDINVINGNNVFTSEIVYEVFKKRTTTDGTGDCKFGLQNVNYEKLNQNETDVVSGSKPILLKKLIEENFQRKTKIGSLGSSELLKD